MTDFLEHHPIEDINRITVEFKFASWSVFNFPYLILIESQWNLNEAWMVCMIIEGCILIESQWNLNF